ncbi:cobyric acid synthase CobQ [filamentous cyanobacterium LEGE 11480]|uniref:Cobyric acid synthase n=1 Tax=Romeriopsis navalis LEGE 11480 TaxID=2777977 RepID=A0A928VQE7_9CYAN|nr:cobyric acid synthase CobQ [Romeriopsis navalis]MBE9030204.1 cobyric acid synthase CobQ [Romeriopsis navalis LEGE 11480]
MPGIMVVGTTSHAGKSLITAAICRILVRQGHRVTPFKGQNMALNSYVTASGGEIGFAQAFQAWAARVEPEVVMNPVLLKPQGNMTSQVILRGKAVGVTNARQYYEDYFEPGWAAIKECLSELSERFDYIVCEGAGSPAEVNLKHRDMTNMRVAKHLNAPTILVVDIDRGGCFAQVIGTLMILEPDERALVKGIVVNKFRGQRDLFDSGVEWLEQETGIPVLGVIPWMDDLFPSEDSLDLMERRGRKKTADMTIAVIRLPRISNFTDFDPLEAEPSVAVKYVGMNDDLGHPDAVILPGSKTTIPDLRQLQASGLAQQIQDYAAAGGTVLGICGGFQMMGRSINDPQGLEGNAGQFDGLGLLPFQTVMEGEKVVRQRQVTTAYPQAELAMAGYEIHLGRSERLLDEGFEDLFDDATLGVVNQSQSLWGSYLHGIFDNGIWRRMWLNQVRQKQDLHLLPATQPNYAEQRDLLIDRLADHMTEYMDLGPAISI